MSVNVSPVSPQTVPIQADVTPAVALPSVEARWAAWQARGIANDRAASRRLILVAPLFVIGVALIYLLLVR